MKIYLQLKIVLQLMDTLLLKSLQKTIQGSRMLQVVLVLAALYLVYNYEQVKSMIVGNFTSGSGVSGNKHEQVASSGVQPSEPLGDNAEHGHASGVGNSAHGPMSNCGSHSVSNPEDLLPPANANDDFSKLQGASVGDLQNVNLLKAGHHIGINTVGTSLRNANLQLRSEFAIPKQDVGPWNTSTISADPYRKALEIGSN